MTRGPWTTLENVRVMNYLQFITLSTYNRAVNYCQNAVAAHDNDEMSTLNQDSKAMAFDL